MKLTPKSFELRNIDFLSGWLWVPLGFLLLVPVLGHTSLVPWRMNDWPLLERGIPISWLLVAGAMAAFMRLSRASIPLAALMTWCLVRTAINSFPLRGIQLMLLMLMVGFLYVVARDMDSAKVKVFTWTLALGTAVEVFLGWLNIFGIYPWMAWVVPDQIGRAMGLLTHPNYWGSLMALVIPIMWALMGPIAVLLIMIPVVVSHSANPVISSLAGIVVCAWPELNKKTKYFLIGSASAVVGFVMNRHEWRLNGRREVWEAIWPEIMRYPIIGQGLGDWRVWADQWNAKYRTPGWATLQAHNEIYQMWFELGLIGVAIILVMALQAAVCFRIVWKFQNTGGPRVLWGRIPIERAWLGVFTAAIVNSFASPTFHLPAQAAIAMFALARIQATAVKYSIADTIVSTKNAAKGRRKENSNA